MDLVAGFALRCMLFILIVALYVNQRIAASYNVCETEKLTGKHKTHCWYCFARKVCSGPYTDMTCNEVAVETVMGNIHRVYPDSVLNFKPSSRYTCFTLRTRRVDHYDYEFRGCTYFSFEKRIINVSFRYLNFYGEKKLQNGTLWENHNRTYWNLTHFFYAFCWFCVEDYCNIRLFNKSAPRKNFQRPIYARHSRTCVMLVNHDYDKFAQQCKDRQVQGKCDSWVWPGKKYEPPIKG